MDEFTFAMIKPDGVKQGAANVIGMIPSHLRICAMRMDHLTDRQVLALYRDHVDKAFFPPMLRFILSGPVVLMVLQGTKAVTEWRKLMGATDSAKAEPNTIRYICGSRMVMYQNVVHGSDSVESASRETALFFHGSELFFD